jgi:hypothetical protein
MPQNSTLMKPCIQYDASSRQSRVTSVRSLTDSAWNKQFQVVLFCEFKNIVKPFDIDSYCQRNIGLADCAEQCTEMYQPIDAFIDDYFLQILEVKNVSVDVLS